MARDQRRLAAILAADVVGYSRLMGRDESGTAARLRELRARLFEPALARGGGRIVKLTGDGALAEFPSAVDAVAAAIEFQQAIAAENRDRADEDVIVFRIGLHLGDLIVEGDDLIGDGVNVAARLESIAPAGGIVVSRAVHEAVAGRLKATFDDLGGLALKNIERPVQAYRVGWTPADWASPAVAADSVQSASAGGPPLALPDRPSLAVLPFQNMSGDPEQDYFADGVVEDLITELSRFRHLFVIARNTSFTYKGRAIDIKQLGRELGVRYVLEGSVRKAGGRVRITAQLIDSAAGGHLWAERYDRLIDDIFAVQDEITRQVAGAIEPALLKIESGRAATRSDSRLTAWDLVCQGRYHFHEVTAGGHARARDLFREAARLDPRLADAHIWLARVNAGLVAFGMSRSPEDDLREGLAAAHRALQLDEKDPYAHYALAIVSVIGDRLDQGVLAAEAAIATSPSFALGHYVLGLGRLCSGAAAGAADSIERGLRLNPYDPQNFVWLQLMALAYLFDEQPDKALATAQRSAKVRPDWAPTLETLAICHAARGQYDDARVHMATLRGRPRPEARFMAILKRRNPVWRERMAALERRVEPPP